MRIFIDTNVLIDLLCEREGYEQAGHILALSDNPQCALYTSVLSIANLAYILRKALKGKALYQSLNKLSNRLNISPMTQESFERALLLEASDFEDALQYYSALQADCEVIVTRNKKDFKFSEIAVCSPDEFLTQFLPFSK